MTTKTILELLRGKLGTEFRAGNHNTGFILTAEGEMLVCEYTKDCKYTKYFHLEKFARRMLTFYKTGY